MIKYYKKVINVSENFRINFLIDNEEIGIGMKKIRR